MLLPGKCHLRVDRGNDGLITAGYSSSSSGVTQGIYGLRSASALAVTATIGTFAMTGDPNHNRSGC